MGLVTSQKIIEREMEYRGSKFTTGHGWYNLAGLRVIKEQRVYGNCLSIRLPRLRCTLMGFEKNYQNQILSNQINKIRLYSSVTINLYPKGGEIDPLFITGFSDAEGSFMVYIKKDYKVRSG